MSLEKLPSEEALETGMASMEADVAEMFGLSADEGAPSSPASPEPGPAAGEDQAPSPAAEPPEGAEPPSPAPEEASGKPAPKETPLAPSSPAAQPKSGAPSAAPAEPPKSDEQALKLHSLEATVAALQVELDRARANPPAAEGQPPTGDGSGTEPAKPALPSYNLTLPQPVFDAVFGEESSPEQQRAGVAHMMNSLATIVHHNVRLETKALIDGLVKDVQEQERTKSATVQAEEGRQQYYSAFPDHDNTLITPLIQAEARQMSAEYPNLSWGADYINALGARVNARIAALTKPKVAQPPAAPAPSLPSGTRKDTPGTPVEGEELIADTFS